MGFFDWLGGGAGTTKPGEDTGHAEGYLDQAAGAYKGASTPKLARVTPQAVTPREAATQQAQAASTGPTAYGDIRTNPANNEAQQAQMAALSNLAKNGGRSAASDANLARIQQGENANARGQRDAIMSNMNARGMGGSGNDLLAQLSSSQNATNNQSARDMDVRGQDQNAALSAGAGAASIGAGLHAQDYAEQAQKAQATDAVNRFNAGNQQTTNVFNAGQGNEQSRFNAGQNLQGQEFNSGQDLQGQRFNSGLGQQTFQNNMAIRQGNQQGGKIGADYWGKKYGEDQKANAGMLGSAINVGSGIAGWMTGGAAAGGAAAAGGGASSTGLAGAGGIAGGGAAGEAIAGGAEAAAPYAKEGAEMYASWGGRVPGASKVPGDSYANDTVPVKTSPGEVIVPRSLVASGSKDQIGSFVKNPPPIAGTQNKEAMLGALKNLRRRR